MKKHLISSFAFTILSSALSFGFNFFLAKYLGAKEYGQIVYYLSFVGILSLIIGFNYTSLYMSSRINQKDENTFSLFFTIHTVALLLALAPFFAVAKFYIDSKVAIFLIALIAYLNLFLSTVGFEFNSKGKVSNSILFSALLPRFLLVVIFTAFILFNLDSPINYLYSLLIANGAIFIYFLLKWKPKFYIKKEIFKRAWKFYLLGIIGSSFTYLSQIFQKEYGSYEQLATLSIVLLFFAGISLVGSVLVKFILPKIHEYFRENNLKEINRLYQNNTFLVILFALPIIIFLMFFIDKISVIFGHGYKSLPIIFYILLLGYGLDLITGITGYMLRAMDSEHYEIYNEIVRLIVGLGLIFLLKDNAYGIAWAISISMVVYNLLKYLEIFYLFKFTPIAKNHIIILFILLVVLTLLNALIKFQISSTFLQMLLIILIYIIYAIWVYRYINKNRQLLQGYK